MVVMHFHHSWSWSIKLVQFHIGDGLTGDQNDTNWSVDIGWGISWSCLFSLKNKESEALSETDGLCSSEHGFGVLVCNGPLLAMQVSWAAPKFKATSYYSVHPLILSATHMNINPKIFTYIYIYIHTHINEKTIAIQTHTYLYISMNMDIRGYPPGYCMHVFHLCSKK